MRKALLLFALACCLPAARSQDIYDLSRIPEIRIRFKETDWDRRLDSLKNARSEERLLAFVTLDGQLLDSVGVRYKGNSSYKNPRSKGQKKLPFNLKANAAVKGQRFPGGYETLKLSNVFQDPSFVREALSYEIARKYMPAPRCNFIKVYVNDEYLGLYNNTQAVDDKLLEDAFGTSKGTFIKCDPEWDDVKDTPAGCPDDRKASLSYMGDNPLCYKGLYEYQGNPKESHAELMNLIKTLGKQPAQAPSLLNVDRVLWMHAFNHVLVNLDSYTGKLSHNFYLYKTPDGLFTPLVWDMNLSFGGFRFDGEKKAVLTNEEMQYQSLFVHYKNPERPLISNLLVNPLYRKLYLGHCRTILQENFANGEYLRIAVQVRQTIDAAVKEDPNKFYSYKDFLDNLDETVDIGSAKIVGVTELMQARADSLLKHPLFHGKNPLISDVRHEQKESGIEVMANVKDGQKVFLSWRYGITESFKMMEMTASDASRYTALVENKPGLQYYLIAEGDRLAVCSPERASHVFYEVK